MPIESSGPSVQQEAILPVQITQKSPIEKAEELQKSQVQDAQDISKYEKAAKKITPSSESRKSKRSIEELREIEKTESEMYIQEKVSLCQVHKGPLEGMVYICPNCGAKYCQNCATALVNRAEGCWVCQVPIHLN